jgi:hypothetical protein
MARPTKYSRKLVTEIFRLMMDERMSAPAAVLKCDIAWSTFSQWVHDQRDDEWFPDAYQRARKAYIERRFLETQDIADDASRDILETVINHTDKDGNITRVEVRRTSDNSAVQRDKLRIDTTMRVAARQFPAEYSETVKQELTGKGGKDLPAPVLNLLYKKPDEEAAS